VVTTASAINQGTTGNIVKEASGSGQSSGKMTNKEATKAAEDL